MGFTGFYLVFLGAVIRCYCIFMGSNQAFVCLRKLAKLDGAQWVRGEAAVTEFLFVCLFFDGFALRWVNTGEPTAAGHRGDPAEQRRPARPHGGVALFAGPLPVDGQPLRHRPARAAATAIPAGHRTATFLPSFAVPLPSCP